MAVPTFWQSMVGGGDAGDYTDPNSSIQNARISELANSHVGADAGANAERAIGRRYSQRDEEIENNPNYGRNAAVSGKLHDMAMNEVGGETANAYVQGAATDQASKEHATQLGLQKSQQDFQVNQENYQRDQNASFGHSFVGGLLKDAIGYGTGSLVGAGVNALTGGGTSDGGTGNGSGSSGNALDTPGSPFYRPPSRGTDYSRMGIGG